MTPKTTTKGQQEMANTIKQTTAGIVVVVSLAAMGYFGYQIVKPLVAFGFVVADRERRDYEMYVRPAEEETFRTVCPQYRDASTWKRWTDSHYRNLAWCGDYLDRL